MRHQRSAQWGAGLSCLLSLYAWAAQGMVNFNLPAMDLCTALIEFYHQSGVPVLFAPPGDECHLRTQPVFGELEPRDALARALAGTGLVLEQMADGILITGSQRARDPPLNGDKSAASDNTIGLGMSEVLVTGSMIHGELLRGVADLRAPVLYLAEKDFNGAASPTVQDVLYALPVNSLNAPREDYLERVDNYQFGSAVNLRGLGVGATLVLVNGRRQPVSGVSGDFVDISNIPLSAVERIEILQDAASTSYGSDAIGGVVNIIMRDDTQGIETQARIGGTPNGRNEVMASVLGGTHWDNGRLVVSYQYLHATALAAAQRQYAADADKRPFGGSNYRSYYSSPGNILDPVTLLPVLGIHSGSGGGAFAYSLSPIINLANQFAGYQIFPKAVSHSLYTAITQEVSDPVELFADGRFTQREATASKSASQEILTVPSTNPFYVSPFAGSNSTLVAYDFLHDLGPNVFSAQIKNYIGTLGARFILGTGWLATCFISFGRETLMSSESNVLDSTALDAALASPVPSQAFDPFGDGSNTSRATLDAIGRNRLLSSASTIETSSLMADGPVFSLPSGTVKLAVGIERRQETLHHDLPVAAATTQMVWQQLSRVIRSAFAELALPMLGNPDQPRAAPRVDAAVAGRFEDYSDFGRALSPSARLRWAPVQGLSLRGSWARSYRAPKLDDLYDTSQNAAATATLPDPRSLTGQSLVLIREGTNSGLLPERATTWTAGFEVAPPVDPGLKLSLTYYLIDYESQITTPALDDPQQILLREGEWASAITRNPTLTQITQICNSPDFQGSRAACLSTSPAAIVDLRLANLGSIRTSGLDMNVHQVLDTHLGVFDFGVVGTRIFHLDQATTKTSPSVDILNTVGGTLGLRLRGTGGWRQRTPSEPGFGVNISVNYTGGYRNPGSRVLPRVASSTTVDSQLQYQAGVCSEWWCGTEVTLNAVNIFNRAPPFVDNSYGYDVANAQPLGRVVSVEVRRRW